MTDVTVPTDLWDTGDGAIAAWLYSDGDLVEAGAILAELMVEKVSFELLAPASGRLKILVPAEEVIARGQAVAQITP
jgi:pyruvate/2-oxoglutarate dehydrogenase complex dihydrolipoamide acyltransferase (E2) component